jgi:long-subunit acyl-CoA synthetase (AMP-forming)
MREYWRDAKATRERFTDDGWLRTGDVGWRDADGFVYVTGRYDNVVVLANGYKISAEAVERVVSDCLGSEQVAVFGVRDVIFIAIYIAASGFFQDEDPKRTTPDRLVSEIEQVCFREFPQLKSAACELRVVCLAQPMSEENGMMTPKGSVRRSRIAEYLGVNEEVRGGD